MVALVNASTSDAKVLARLSNNTATRAADHD